MPIKKGTFFKHFMSSDNNLVRVLFKLLQYFIPVLFHPRTNKILQEILAGPLLALHTYVPKSEMFFGVTTSTLSKMFTLDDCVTERLPFDQLYVNDDELGVVT